MGACAFKGGDVTSGGKVVRFGFGDGEEAGMKPVGEGAWTALMGCGDSTVAILSSDMCCFKQNELSSLSRCVEGRMAMCDVWL
jgi:hypothetical protein